MGKSVLAIVAGFLAGSVIALGLDAIAGQLWPDIAGPPVEAIPVLVAMIIYTEVAAGIGAAITARLAPRHPVEHALVGGSIGLLLGLGATISLWNTAPAWYHITTLILILPAAWAGGTIGAKRRTN